jgi:hypothetical protein
LEENQFLAHVCTCLQEIQLDYTANDDQFSAPRKKQPVELLFNAEVEEPMLSRTNRQPVRAPLREQQTPRGHQATLPTLFAEEEAIQKSGHFLESYATNPRESPFITSTVEDRSYANARPTITSIENGSNFSEQRRRVQSPPTLHQPQSNQLSSSARRVQQRYEHGDFNTEVSINYGNTIYSVYGIAV